MALWDQNLHHPCLSCSDSVYSVADVARDIYAFCKVCGTNCIERAKFVNRYSNYFCQRILTSLGSSTRIFYIEKSKKAGFVSMSLESGHF